MITKSMGDIMVLYPINTKEITIIIRKVMLSLFLFPGCKPVDWSDLFKSDEIPSDKGTDKST